MYIYIYTYIYAYIYMNVTYIHTWIYPSRIYTCKYIRIQTYMYIYICVRTYIQIYGLPLTHMHMQHTCCSSGTKESRGKAVLSATTSLSRRSRSCAPFLTPGSRSALESILKIQECQKNPVNVEKKVQEMRALEHTGTGTLNKHVD